MNDPTLDPDRVARAAVALEDGRARIEPTGPGEYRVGSFSTPGREYRVRLADRDCDCPDSLYRGATCKHVALVALLRGLED